MPQLKKVHSEQSNLPFLKDNTPQTKPCTVCGEEKELDQFFFRKKGLPGKRAICKKCKLDGDRVQGDEYKKANEERIKNGTQEECIKSLHPDGTKLCPQCKVVRDLSDFGVSLTRRFGIYHQCRGCGGFRSATSRGKKKTWKAMELTQEEYLDIYYRDKCSYCYKPNPRGVDRIDSSKPYTKDNTQPLCFICNTAKNDLTESELFLHIEKMHEHIKKRKKSPRNKEENLADRCEC